MKIITEYQCDICQQRYDSEAEAIECVARGIATEYPIGCIYANHTSDCFYKHITFAIAGNEMQGHCNSASLWAFRDNFAGDSLTLVDRCHSGNYTELNEYDAKIDRDHPTFARCVAFLKKHNIPITIWDGKKAVPYEE